MLVKIKEPTVAELEREIVRMKQMVRAYKLDERTQRWCEKEIDRLEWEIVRVEKKKERSRGRS